MIIEQESFAGGMDLITLDTQIKNDSYVYGINVRTRYGSVVPTPKAVKVTQIPGGKLQGIISVGTSVVLFANGRAYFKVTLGGPSLEIPGFQMSPDADVIYTQTVPISSLQFPRKLSDDTNILSNIEAAYGPRIQGMPSGIVCQDGITQPYLLTYDEVNKVFFATKLGTYATWSKDFPEYVPIGKQMMYLSGKLFIVAPNQLSVYQSVSGQPLNFMVNITPTGDKNAVENDGGAATVSFAFDYNKISCLIPVNIPDAFIIASQTTTRVIGLDYSRTVFGEPLFSQLCIIDTGVVSPYAIADVNGDYAFANVDGIRSFNAVQQLKFNGRNTVFSRVLSRLFVGVLQTWVTTISFDNYVMFSMDSISGPILAVYDSINNVWVSVDQYDIGKVMFATVVTVPGLTFVAVVTDKNEVYRLFDPRATAAKSTIQTRAYSTSGVNNATGEQTNINTSLPVTEIKSQKVDLMFRNSSRVGNITATEFCNSAEQASLIKPIKAVAPISLQSAIERLSSEEGERITYNFNNSQRGYKLSYKISWDTYAAMVKLRIVTTDTSQVVSDTQRDRTIGSKQI